METEKTVVLVSGGMDSFVAYHYEQKKGENVMALYVDYKGRYCQNERKKVIELFPKLFIDMSLHLKKWEIGDKAFIKNRNALFALIASNYGSKIVMGGLKDDHVGDKTPQAFKAMETLLNTINDTEHKVYSPFWEMEKVDVLEWYLRSGLPREDVLKTHSCYSNKPQPCQRCAACFRRFCAFTYCGVFCEYFTNKGLVKEYLIKYQDDKSKRGYSVRHAAKLLEVSL